MENYKISFLQEQDYGKYASFLKECPEALYEHDLAIKDLVAKHFKFKPSYLIAKENEKIAGVLPIFEAKSILEGTRFVSIPFFPFGGVIGKDIDCKRQLLDKAKELAANAKFLQIRQREELLPELVQEMVVQKPITNFFIDLKKGEPEMFASLDKSIRYDIRKAQKHHLPVVIGTTPLLLNDFYTVYLNTRKKRGVPAWPYGLFQQALQNCNTKVAVTYHQQKPIAASFLFMDKETIEYAFAGTDYRYSWMCPYYLLIWEIIRFGIRNNYKTLELGGSTREMNDGNMYLFKDQWATRKAEIPYYFYAADPQNIPSLHRSFALYRWYGRFWRLLPTAVIKRISPFIIRQFV
ncbi:peptidoglycan bridge formation glycyltransferase FemA/FemB family protein [Candidatus Woesearchaeota archaeon]|nr:peptidoglycan bridge formation glycyltransferase FemA/FemB family protein [Candidatus Woesearchaeota archaeon]